MELRSAKSTSRTKSVNQATNLSTFTVGQPINQSTNHPQAEDYDDAWENGEGTQSKKGAHNFQHKNTNPTDPPSDTVQSRWSKSDVSSSAKLFI